MADPDFLNAVRASSARLGISPSDLLTAISFETGGRLSPSLYGGSGGKYLGLIQFSPENQKRYGVHPGQTAVEQMGAVEAYLRDRGVKPGMGLLDTYSAINAGAPGLYNRSDTANGGTPGTVADKVATQMYGHRKRAEALLGGDPGAVAGPSPGAAATPAARGGGGAPVSLGSLAPAAPAVEGDSGNAALMAALMAIPQATEDAPAEQPVGQTINFPTPPGIARARAYARAMAARPLTG